jgi:dipeptidyl aminopeptidase/acylaminoacyl peptidase
MRSFLLSCLLVCAMSTALAQQKASTSFEQWISLKRVSAPQIAPDGSMIVYTVTTTDWKENRYDTELWLWKKGGEPFQLTRNPEGSSINARFTPDGKYVSFTSDRGKKSQLFIIPVNGGEALQVTNEEDGVSGYEWSPDGKWLGITRLEPESKKTKQTKENYGGFFIEGQEFRLTHLWKLKVDLDTILAIGALPCHDETDSVKKKTAAPCPAWPKAIRLTEGDFTVTRFDWSPDGKSIAYVKQPDPLINTSVHSDIAIVDIATGKSTTVVNNPSSDNFGSWSPDGGSFVYSTFGADTATLFYANNKLMVHDLSSGKDREIGGNVDEEKEVLDWNREGIYFSVQNAMRTDVYQYTPADGQLRNLPTPHPLITGAHYSPASGNWAFAARDYDGLTEISVFDAKSSAMSTVTNMTAQIKTWNTPVNQVISWKSKDGITIQGILIKPRDFDMSKKYPLLVVIHGGPTGIDLPDPVAGSVYPIMQWAEKGAIVLRVNYRGSSGYGEKFRALNVRNLGVGDMWDVMSGVDYLRSKGMIDTSRMGCMGWSQGGYISAFLTTNTNSFKAISVGAGISDWSTYYVNTDITPFTRQYLKATPWSDPAIYAKTSPISNINKASTPTLIQHGEFDKRVPLPNAYELYRGLQDRNIPSKLIVYKGFGHGITKPKERLAAVWHNWNWFNQYIFGEKEEEMPGTE